MTLKAVKPAAQFHKRVLSPLLVKVVNYTWLPFSSIDLRDVTSKSISPVRYRKGKMADTLPQKYKAMIYDQPGKISTKMVELDMPEPAAGEVLIKL